MESQAKYGSEAKVFNPGNKWFFTPLARMEKIEFKLYLGGKMGTEPIKAEFIENFFKFVVVPRLESYTVLKGIGTWKGMNEETTILVFIGTADDRTTVKAVGQVFKRQFLQESVFMTETAVITEEL